MWRTAIPFSWRPARPFRWITRMGSSTCNRLRFAVRTLTCSLRVPFPLRRMRPCRLKLIGTVNLQLAQLFSPDVRTSGQLKFNINSSGAVAGGANLGGEIDVVDANFASSELPVGLQHGNGVLTLTTDRVNISKFQGTIGGGTVTAQGGVAFRPGVQFDWVWRQRESAHSIHKACGKLRMPISGSPAQQTARS